MNCVRCGSLTFKEIYVDHHGTAGQTVAARHCVICGDIVNPLILRHRQQTLAPIGDKARLQRQLQPTEERQNSHFPNWQVCAQGLEIVK